MVYITPDGKVLQNKPWGFSRLVDIFWGTIDFVNLFFRSLVGLDRPAVSSGSGRSGGSGGPGQGPPRPPRRMGGITTIQDCSMPGGG